VCRVKMTYKDKLLNWYGSCAHSSVFTTKSIARATQDKYSGAALKATERAINGSALFFHKLDKTSVTDEHGRSPKALVLDQLTERSRRERRLILFGQILDKCGDNKYLALNDSRGGRRWIRLEPKVDVIGAIQNALIALCEFEKKNIVLIPSGPFVQPLRQLVKNNKSRRIVEQSFGSLTISLEIYSHGKSEFLQTATASHLPKPAFDMSHLDWLEAEAIHIIREVMAEADNPVMLYSVGKDSSVMLHLARKAFYPGTPPFPLLHVDTCWKFQAMYDFRDFMTRELGMNLLIHVNPEGVAKNINPFDHGSALHTDIMKTQSLKMALDHYKFDVAFGGARRDEEKSRAKERIFSFRTSSHLWDPKNQRPELWNLYNGKKNKGETIRVFPISNWTELDIWQYIYREKIPIVPLYFALERPVIERDGMLIMVDDDRVPINPNETIQLKKVRFRTLGCYPLTGAVESDADDLGSIVLEILDARTSERQGRAIDKESTSSMEKKKQEGYF
jgi:sulfate adenylyltransferase subunit 2